MEIQKLNLTNLNQKKMKELTGGCVTLGDCGCACAYREIGGASTYDNTHWNKKDGLKSPQCPD